MIYLDGRPPRTLPHKSDRPDISGFGESRGFFGFLFLIRIDNLYYKREAERVYCTRVEAAG
jgi:hypothetical protein